MEHTWNVNVAADLLHYHCLEMTLQTILSGNNLKTQTFSPQHSKYLLAKTMDSFENISKVSRITFLAPWLNATFATTSCQNRTPSLF